MKLSNLAAALAIAGFGLASSSANALIVQDAWGFNISGGSTVLDGTTLSNVGHLGLNGGFATVQQQLTGGQIVVGSTFTESGFIFSSNYVPENVPGFGDYGSSSLFPSPLYELQIVFTGLSGTVTSYNNLTGAIQYLFDAGVGDVTLQGRTSSSGTYIDLATGEIVDPSGGDLNNFYGQSQTQGQSTVLAQFDTFLNGFTFDLFGPGLGFSDPSDLFMQVVTTNKIQSPATPCGANCAQLTITSDGSADLLKVPEPMSLALVGLGLLGIGVVRRRKQLA